MGTLFIQDVYVSLCVSCGRWGPDFSRRCFRYTIDSTSSALALFAPFGYAVGLSCVGSVFNTTARDRWPNAREMRSVSVQSRPAASARMDPWLWDPQTAFSSRRKGSRLSPCDDGAAWAVATHGDIIRGLTSGYNGPFRPQNKGREGVKSPWFPRKWRRLRSGLLTRPTQLLGLEVQDTEDGRHGTKQTPLMSSKEGKTSVGPAKYRD